MIGGEGKPLPLGEARSTLTFYGEPVSMEAAHGIKTTKDEHSLRASWFTIEELREM